MRSPAAARPGLPRLLFQDVGDAGSPFRPALAQLVASQRALLGALIGRAQASGALPAALDARASARLLLAGLQGLLLQRQLAGGAGATEDDAGALLEAWRAGAEAGRPAGAAPGRPRPVGSRVAIAALDARPILAGGEDPLAAILEALGGLAPDGVLKVVAPFRPAPLLALLSARGMRVSAREAAPGVWAVEAAAPGAPAPMDLRALEAPAPMARALEAAARLAPGEALLARTPRVPRLLLPRLAERGLEVAAYEEPDGAGLVHARRPA